VATRAWKHNVGNLGRSRGRPYNYYVHADRNGEVFGPEPLGKTSVLLNGGTILKIGAARTPDSSS